MDDNFFSSKIYFSIICFNNCQLKNQKEIQAFGPFLRNVKIMPKSTLLIMYSNYYNINISRGLKEPRKQTKSGMKRHLKTIHSDH